MFEYELKFHNTTAHANADAWSQLPLSDTVSVTENPPELVLLTTHLENSLLTADQIKAATHRDPELALVLQYVQQGWPSHVSDDSLKP